MIVICRIRVGDVILRKGVLSKDISGLKIRTLIKKDITFTRTKLLSLKIKSNLIHNLMRAKLIQVPTVINLIQLSIPKLAIIQQINSGTKWAIPDKLSTKT